MTRKIVNKEQKAREFQSKEQTTRKGLDQFEIEEQTKRKRLKNFRTRSKPLGSKGKQF